MPQARRWNRISFALLALAWAVASSAFADGEKRDPKAGPVQLKGAPIRDLATSLRIPLSDEAVLTVDLPPRFWLQCPRHLPVPTSLAGDGVIVHYLTPRGGSVSMLYAGTVPWTAAKEVDGADATTERAAGEFVAGLARAYERVDWRLLGPAPELKPAFVTVDGKKTPAWRTARYATEPLQYAGPESRFSGECLLFRPEGAPVLVYLALDAKAGGTTLDKAIERLSVKPVKDVLGAGRRLQLDDLAESSDPTRFPVRLIALDLPAGFVPTKALRHVDGEWVFVEQHLDAKGEPDGTLRIGQRLAAAGETLEQALQAERASWTEQERGPVEEVPLAIRGHRAFVFAHPSPVDGDAARAFTAVLRFDDLVFRITCARRDAAQAEAAKSAFLQMIRSVELAVRW